MFDGSYHHYENLEQMRKWVCKLCFNSGMSVRDICNKLNVKREQNLFINLDNSNADTRMVWIAAVCSVVGVSLEYGLLFIDDPDAFIPFKHFINRDDRDEYMYTLFKFGYTYEMLGKEYGLSGGRIQQIISHKFHLIK